MRSTTLLGEILVIAVLISAYAAQAANITGFIVDASSGEPLPVASAVIEDSDRGATTNLDGYFVINYIPPGVYRLIFSHLGYHNLIQDVRIMEMMEPLQVELQPTRVQLKEVEVKVKREEIKDQRKTPTVSAVAMDSRLIRTMPSLGGEMDVMRAMQTIPGVKAASDISSALHVRGGSPDQTLILMDHNTVYNPTHMFGLFSTFNSDAVKYLELLKGGFPAKYGGRSGSVLEVIMNDGNRKNYHGLFSIGLISGRAALEGPLSIGGKKGSFAGSFRRTYIDYVVDAMRESGGLDLPDYYFYDHAYRCGILGE